VAIEEVLMATKTGQEAKINTLVVTISLIGILVVVNVLSYFFYGRIDLTDNKRYTLSEVSKKAIQDLESLDVQVFISKDLPPTITVGYGQERDIRGVDREFLDKLEEYRSYSGGRMRITRVTDNIEEKAEQAKLELFTSKEAQVQGGRLEFKKYALGATFQYMNQMEVFPLAIEPAYFEFEITRILLRLKEKYQKSAQMEDILKAGKDIADAVQQCKKKLDSYQKKEEGQGLAALLAGGDVVRAIQVDRVNFKKECDQVGAMVANSEIKRGKNEYLDQLIQSGKMFAQTVDEISKMLEDKEARTQEVARLVDRLEQLSELVEKDHDNLKNSPGRKAIGFLCGHGEFCPFPDPEPLIRPEIAGLLGQRNPLVQQFVAQAKQIEDQINSINEQLRRGLFVRRGLTVKRIDAGEDIPDDVAVVVVYGAQSSLGERDLYNIDQFLLRGGTVIVFLKNFDVAVYNLKKSGDEFDMGAYSFEELHRNPVAHNLDDFLKHYGVQVNRDLVLEKKNFEPITIIQVQRQGQFTIQSQREFPYPLLPTFTDFDSTHVLVRRIANVTMPYVSSLFVTAEARANPNLEATELIKSSREAVATKDPIEISPPRLLQAVQQMESNGPHTVAVALKGQFVSFFKDKEKPQRPEKKGDDEKRFRKKEVERPFVESGHGRLLVIGTDFGLENLSPRRVMEGFEMSQLSSGTADFFLKIKDYIANFQNWNLRLSQIASTLQSNLDFIYNCLDYGLQDEALVDIRSKGFVRRPIQNISSGGKTAIVLAYAAGLPLVFVAFGVGRVLSRRRK
jgi:ABC-type uncharacterized transport system involved in gliding motility auxiliary subunit